jgi:Ran GTPase-activating protein (RanGAP) involved in mRNA processing and transport
LFEVNKTIDTLRLNRTLIFKAKNVNELLQVLITKSSIKHLDLTQDSYSQDSYLETVKLLTEILKDNTVFTHLNLTNYNGMQNPRYLAEDTIPNLPTIYFNTSSSGVKSFVEVLKYNTTFTHLNLRENYIGVEGINQLIDNGLKYNTTLTYLNLAFNNLGPEGIKYLTEFLKQNTTITHLNLELNNIRSEGIQYLTEFLKQDTIITHLDLSKNNIGAEGIKQLIDDALKYNTAITHLNLCGTNLMIAGATHLAEFLKQNTTITHLNLRQTNLGPEGIKQLIDNGLKYNTAITHLDLSVNQIGLEGIKYLTAFLKHNTTIIHLNLREHNLYPLMPLDLDENTNSYQEEMGRVSYYINRNIKILYDVVSFIEDYKLNSKEESDSLFRKIPVDEYHCFRNYHHVNKSLLAEKLALKGKDAAGFFYKMDTMINQNMLQILGVCKLHEEYLGEEKSINGSLTEDKQDSLRTTPKEIKGKIFSYLPHECNLNTTHDDVDKMATNLSGEWIEEMMA